MTHEEKEEDWMCVEDAAKYFKVTKSTIYRWIKRGKLRVHNKSFSYYIVDVNSFQKEKYNE